MAEQEFLSHWFGRDGRWYALPPEFNFQLHQVFLSSKWWPPGGQQRPSKYYQMLVDTRIIKNWHFSGEKEPVDCLYELVPGESAEVLEWRIDMLAQDSMLNEWDAVEACQRRVICSAVCFWEAGRGGMGGRLGDRGDRGCSVAVWFKGRRALDSHKPLRREARLLCRRDVGFVFATRQGT